jgi:predicted HTH domain antitoxin
MELSHKKLGISIIGNRMTPEIMLLENFCEYLEQLPENIRRSISDVISFKSLMLYIELYRNNQITLGKFAEVVGVPIHDAAKILESQGITPELGSSTKKELDEEIKIARRIG